MTEEIRRLSEDEVKAAVESELADALSVQTQLRSEQQQGLERYLAKPWNHVEGRSKAQLDDVRDTVEWILPSLVRMFLGGHKTVSYGALRPEDEEWASDATEVVNQLVRTELDGFTVIYDMVKTALIEKVGTASVRAERVVDRKVKVYEGLTDPEFDALLSEEGVELMAWAQSPDMLPVPQPDGSVIPEPLYDARVMHVKPYNRIVMEAIPTEEFFIGRRERALNDDTRFCGVQRRMTISDLIDLGVPREKALALPNYERLDQDATAQVRREQEQLSPTMSPGRPDPVSREVVVNDITMTLDADGDGHAELRRILCVGTTGTTLLHNDYVNSVDYASVTPYRLPFKWAGLSVADLLTELEQIRTVILRQILDNFYATNHSRVAVLEGEVEIEALISARPGGVVPCRSDPSKAVFPLLTPPIGPQGTELLQMLDQVREDRAGASRLNQGLDASALNESTATGMMQMMAAAAARIELIARIMVPGIERLFRLLLRKLVETPNQQRMMKLRGRWTHVDPSTWNADWAVCVEVGLGQGRAQERIVQLENLFQKQTLAAQEGFQMAPYMHNLVEDMVGAMGLPGGVGRYFPDPKVQPPQPPGPTPEQQIEMGKLENAKAQTALKQQQLQETARDHDLEHQRKLTEISAQREMEMERIASQERIAMMQLEAAQAQATSRKEAA